MQYASGVVSRLLVQEPDVRRSIRQAGPGSGNPQGARVVVRAGVRTARIDRELPAPVLRAGLFATATPVLREALESCTRTDASGAPDGFGPNRWRRFPDPGPPGQGNRRGEKGLYVG